MSSETSIPVAEPPRIAILLNSYKSKFLPAIRESYVRAIAAVAPEAALTFFEPANTDRFPDPALFDLIVFGGANVDARNSHPWILKIHEFLRHLVIAHPDKKILGICWGHQTIARALGGRIVDMDEPEMGVYAMNLTETGRHFFPDTTSPGVLHLQQHHRREVAQPGRNFSPLAQNNQILKNQRNTILSFQGHPEKDAQTAALRVKDATRWFGFDAVDEKAWAKLQTLIEAEHEGLAVWRRILEWVREPPVPCGGLESRELKI